TFLCGFSPFKKRLFMQVSEMRFSKTAVFQQPRCIRYWQAGTPERAHSRRIDDVNRLVYTNKPDGTIEIVSY
ncbi:MAG: hypothetical protein LBR98_07185, partial [Syntrophomonadaceae bacterium]|nr:hypothetical protein [Syntrophomonadaceae bacterium]